MAGVTKYITWSGGPDGDYICTGTNDHTVINRALAWAAANPGNTVYIRGPATGIHEYNISGQIKVGSYTTWDGDSTAVLKIPDGACGDSIEHCVFPNGTPVIYQLSLPLTCVEIRGFKIDGNCQNQYNKLGYAHGNPSSAGSGVERLIHFQGTSSAFNVEDINIHDMEFCNAFGEAAQIIFAKNIRFHHNICSNHQHEGVFFKGVVGAGNAIHHNTIEGISSDCVRCDNCKNVDIYNNTLSAYDGPNTNGATTYGHQGIQIANASTEIMKKLNLTTDNINVYNNTINGKNLSGIWINDTLKTAGTTAQRVHIHHNRINGCGWASWTAWASGIGIQWGNGIIIEKNTIDGSYCDGILVYGIITPNSTSINIKNNNIINTLSYRAGAKNYPSVLGYGIANLKSNNISVKAEGNYSTNNIKGNYSGVTPVSTSSSLISDAMPDTGTEDDDTETPDDPYDTVPDDGIYIPSTSSIIDDEYKYIERGADDVSAYINYVPFDLVSFRGAGSKVLGDSKSPNVAGSNISDFDFEGSDVELKCITGDLDSFYKILASFYRKGRSTIELGGPFKGYKITGTGSTHIAGFDESAGDIPTECLDYNLTFKTEKPYMEWIQKRVRGRYIYNSMQYSSDDIYKGNIVKNPSFEDWTANSSLDWVLQTPVAVNSFECVKYAPEINLYCVVSSTGTDNKVMLSDGTAWRLPTGLTNATNCNNNWGSALCWCPDWMLWVALSTSGVSGYSCMISPDTDNWAAKATPSAADSNTWSCSVFVPRGEGVYLASSDDKLLVSSDDFIFGTSNGSYLENGRVIAFASSGTGRVMYSEDQCETWIIPTLDPSLDAHSWISADISPTLQRIVVVASDGAVAYSDDYADTWTICEAPSQKWTCVKWADALELFMVCSEDGDKQIMTSPTGLSGTWTLQTTPYLSSTTVNNGSVVVNNLSGVSPTGYNYTTLQTSYMLEYSFVLPALGSGHIYRIDNVFCKLRSLNSTNKSYMKVTISSVSLGSDVLVKEWTETSTDFVQKSFDLALESATNEAVTLKFWIKTTKPCCKAASTLLGYKASEVTVGGSTITYTRPKLSGIEWANEFGLAVAISKDTVGNKIIYSTSGSNWILSDSAADDAWDSLCVADERGEFMAVSNDGTVMVCNGYGELKDVAPNGWVLETRGQSRSEEYAIDGKYSLQIDGDGVSEQPGRIVQILPFDGLYDSGEMYILSGKAKVSGLTSGSFSVDIYAGGTIIKELVWTVDTDEWQIKNIKFKLDTYPPYVYLRVHGTGTPNIGSHFNFDDIIISKESDLELKTSGADIYTSGYYDVIPDVTVRGISTISASASSSKVISDVTGNDETFSSLSTSYGAAKHEVVLPALTGGSIYRINNLSFAIKSSNPAAYTYMKITIQAASMFSGKETALALWTTNQTTSFLAKTYTLPYTLESAINEKVTIRYYIRTSRLPYIAFARLFGYQVTEILDTVTISNNSISLYNVNDSRRVMKCCNALPQGHMVQIKSNYTGSYRYVELFSDDAYVSNAYSITGSISRNDTTQTLMMDVGSAWVFPIDTLHPVTGIPFIKLYVVSGIPQISIADDSGANGAPGTFYPVDSNTSNAVTKTDIQRELDNINNLRLRGRTKYYVKIEPYLGASCEFGQMLEYASTDTMDVQRFFIYAGGRTNTIGVQVGGTGKCSAVVSLDYNDANILP